MSDPDTQTQDEGTQAANPAVSGAGAGDSFDPAAFEKRVTESILTALRSDKSLVQSVKDQAIDAAKKDKGFRSFLAEYREMKNAGMTDVDIEREVRLRELEARTQQPAPVQPGTPNSGAGINPAEFASLLGLDLSDHRVAEAATQPDAIERLVGLAKVTKKPANPAVSIAQPASVPAPSNEEQKAAELEKLMKDPVRNAAAIKKLRQELGW